MYFQSIFFQNSNFIRISHGGMNVSDVMKYFPNAFDDALHWRVFFLSFWRLISTRANIWRTAPSKSAVTNAKNSSRKNATKKSPSGAAKNLKTWNDNRSCKFRNFAILAWMEKICQSVFSSNHSGKETSWEWKKNLWYIHRN